MNTNKASLINGNNFHNALNASVNVEQTNAQHNTLSLNSEEISAIEHKIFFEKTKNTAEQEICLDSNLQLPPLGETDLQKKDNFLSFVKSDTFQEILDDVINDINKVTELSLPYVTDKNKFKADMNILVAKLKNIDYYAQNGISALIEFFRLTREQIKTSIQLFYLIKASNTDENQKLVSEYCLKMILSSSIEEDMNLCIAGVITRVLQLYCGLKNFLGKGELIKEIITNIVSALAQESIKNEITAGNKVSNKIMNVHDSNSLKKIMEKPFGITCPYDPVARDITDDLTIKLFKNKAEIAACSYNILLTLGNDMLDRLKSIVNNESLFTTGVAEKDIPDGLIADIDKFFINPLNSMLSSDASTAININDILEVDDNDVYTINNLPAKLSFLIPQKLLGKKAEWLVGEISTQYCSADSQQLIVAIGNSYFGVIDKQNLYTDKKAINLTFDNNIPVQLQHITPKLITNNNLQKASYRPLIINALQNTNNVAEILNFFNNLEIKNILQQDIEFLEYLSTIISMKIAGNFELKESLANLICNEIMALSENNTNILDYYFHYIMFMNSTLLAPILHKLLDNKIDITDILVKLEIPQIVNLSEKDSLKQLCDRALNITDNTNDAKQKIIARFTKIHYKLMQYGHSHVIPLIINTNLINPALGKITENNENELLICARYRNAESIKVIIQENARRSKHRKLNINHQNNKGDTALMISARNGNVATLTEILKDENIAINMQKKNGTTALMIAAKNGHSTCIEILLKHEADINSKEIDGYTALMIAAKNGHSTCIEILLKHEADINSKQINGYTALMISAQNGHSTCMEILLKQKADINTKQINGYTALMFAAYNGHHSCIEILLDHKADINSKDITGYTALMFATNSGNIECLNMLLKHKANVDAKQNNGFTALIIASKNGHVSCVEILLKHEANVDAKQNNGFTALMIASKNGHVSCVKTLLKHKASINLQNNSGDTALTVASQNGHVACVEILLKHEASINLQDKEGNTPLMHAVEKGHFECIKILLEHKADVNLPKKDGSTALKMATQNGHAKCVEILLKHEIDINRKINNSTTVLTIAVEKDQPECMEILLKHNANVNLKNYNDNTALMIAVQRGRTECVKRLLKYKADINLCNKDGFTALMIAAEKDHLEVMEILLENYENINFKTKLGFTALMIAAENSNAECVEILLKYKADIDLFNNNGFTALMVATEKGRLRCMEILLKHGADVNLKNIYNETALDIAKRNKYKECITCLKKYTSTQCAIM